MAWLDAIAVELFAEMQTTDPTSLELAAAGVFTFLVYQMVARPGYARRNDWAPTKTLAKPPATADLRQAGSAKPQAVGQSSTEQRRVA